MRKRVPVILDSGVRRGTDVFTALALGADAVGIGRPYLWGLGAFGEAGVARVLRLLKAELRTVMAIGGTRALLAQYPAHGVGHIRLATAIRADDGRHAAFEYELGMIGECLESMDFELRQPH